MRFLTVVRFAAVATLVMLARPAAAQVLTDIDRDRGRVMLRAVRTDLERHYFDSTYGGMNVAQRFDSAAQRIERATSNGEIFGIIAQVLVDLDDSHTAFYPPERAAHVRYDWELLAVGDSVYVAAVKPGSNAERAGLRAGDLLVTVNGFTPTRGNLWKLRYLFEYLRPQLELRVVAQDTSGARREVRVAAEVEERKRRLDFQLDGDRREIDLEHADSEQRRRAVVRERAIGDVFVWKLDAFSLKPDELDARLRKLHEYRAVVIDLRGNGGGFVMTLERLVGHLLPGKVLISTGHTRRSVDTLWSRPARKHYAGEVVVLIDSRSASASESLARVLQLHKRATIVGDRSAGALIVARGFWHTAGADRVVPFAVKISVQDVRMSDGRRLEKVGVMPDELVLPGAKDLAAGRDPALALALNIVGAPTTPEEAGKLFPARWER